MFIVGETKKVHNNLSLKQIEEILCHEISRTALSVHFTKCENHLFRAETYAWLVKKHREQLERA